MIKVVEKWNENDKRKLIELYQLDYKFDEIATKLNRTYSAIASEVQELRKAGKLGYRKSNAEAAANERGLFKTKPVEFKDNVVIDSIRDAMTAKSARANTIFNEILENIRYTHDKKNDDYKDSYSDTMKLELYYQ